MLTPMDIHNKEFKRSFRGYNEDEIDEFLDQVVNDYERLYRENDQLKKDLELSKKANVDYVNREQTIKDTLVMAQKTAEEVTKSAKENAEALKEATARDCQNLRRQTEIDCKDAQQKAEREAQQMIAEARERVRRIVEEYDRLVRAKNDYLTKVRTSLAQELAIVEQTMKELPDPTEVDRAAGVAVARAKDAAAEEKSAASEHSESAAAAQPKPEDQASSLRAQAAANGVDGKPAENEAPEA
ncbi:DivIVA domain-containing protein [uncultured Selenomonas sp.]|uniref:DivIVA domain-containing protein n=1 Tax=uncultured Selenomonas sp. TaxID=159275 RepID=UPI0025FC94E1|nr:DivIVA domain-containing protein [uncultured Selenomonas sp.]